MTDVGATGPIEPGLGSFSRPRWSARARVSVVLGVAVVVAGSILLDLGGRPSADQRAGDLRALVTQVNVDIASCNASIGDSFEALSVVTRGRNDERSTAERIAAGDEPYCTPVGNSDLYDMDTLEVPSSLRQTGAQEAITTLGNWAFPTGAKAINDVVAILEHPSDAAARTDLRLRLRQLHQAAASANGAFAAAARSLNTTVATLDVGAPDRLTIRV